MVLGAELSLGTWAWAIASTVFVCIPLAVSMWAFLDAARRPQWAWALSNHRQVVWMAAILMGALIVIGGLIVSAWYLAKVRPAIAAVESGDLSGALGPQDGPHR